MTALFRKVAQSDGFTRFVTGAIVIAGILVGVETYPDLVHRYEGPLHLLDKVILGIFVVEIVVKIGAEGAKPWRYFKDGWNVFDFVIVAAAFLPLDAQYVTVLRLLRLLRVLKLVRALPKLQVIVGALLKSIPSMGYVGVLLGLLFYVYGVAATFLFGHNDPVHFGKLTSSLLTLFQLVTLEAWTDLLNIQVQGCDKFGYDGIEALCTAPKAQPAVAIVFFLSFILLGTMIMLNLFIGVIMNGMQEAQEEQADADRAARPDKATLAEDLGDLQRQLVELTEKLGQLKRQSELEAKQAAAAPSEPPAEAAPGSAVAPG